MPRDDAVEYERFTLKTFRAEQYARLMWISFDAIMHGDIGQLEIPNLEYCALNVQRNAHMSVFVIIVMLHRLWKWKAMLSAYS